MKYYLAIDIGASSGRHILGWLENGKIKTQEIYRFPNLPDNENGKLKWNIARLYTEILNGLKKAKDLGKIPESVGVDTWGVDYVLLDKNDDVIDGAYCYRDSRTEKTIPKVHSIIPFNRLFEKTGISFNTFNTIYQLYDDLLSGRIEKAESFLLLPNYFHYLLTGVKKQEYTIATTTGMVNAQTHDWDEEIISALGYKKDLFTQLSQPSNLVGEFSKETAKIVGYASKVVLPATHDTASAVLAAPLQDNTPYISSGTWSLLGVEQEQAHTSDFARENAYSNEGSVNGQFRLQKNIMGLWMIQQVRHELNDKYSFAELADMATKNPVPYQIDVNDNRFLAPKSMIDEIHNAVGKKLTVGETAYVIYNNLANDYASSLSALEKMTGMRYQTLNVIGGGSKNELLNKLTKEKTGKRVITGPAEGTAIGNLLAQMIGAGEIDSINNGRKIIKQSFDITEV